MSDFVTKAITVKASDYKDNDKLIKLFTPNGFITVAAKGVKKANAKLKFCVQPFCFSEVVVHKGKGFDTLIGAELLDSFFDLTQDYDRFMCACVVLECLDATIDAEADMFVLVLRSFAALLDSVFEALAKFLIDSLTLMGYGYKFDKCNECKNTVGKFWFDLERGVVCQACHGEYDIPFSVAAQSAIRILSGTTFDRLATVKLNKEALLEAIMLLAMVYRDKSGVELKSVKALVNQ